MMRASVAISKQKREILSASRNIPDPIDQTMAESSIRVSTRYEIYENVAAAPRLRKREGIGEEGRKALRDGGFVYCPAPRYIPRIMFPHLRQQTATRLRLGAVGTDKKICGNCSMPDNIRGDAVRRAFEPLKDSSTVIAIIRKSRSQREIDGFPGGKLLRHILSPAVAPISVEVAPPAARGSRQGRRAVPAKDFSQLMLDDDAGTAGLHGARMPLEDFDVGTAVPQGQAGAQTADRAARDYSTHTAEL